MRRRKHLPEVVCAAFTLPPPSPPPPKTNLGLEKEETSRVLDTSNFPSEAADLSCGLALASAKLLVSDGSFLGMAWTLFSPGSAC